MKTYQSTRRVCSDIERLLATNRPSFGHSPLGDVSDLLSSGRHYTWVGIYLAVGNSATQKHASRDPQPGQKASPESRSKILISMKLAGRELGVLGVESNRERAFGAEDRVLLENVANLLARFLAVRGQYLIRQARIAAAAA